MHCWIELDFEALKGNFSIFRDILGESKFAPVLKANAYGHGLEEVFSVLRGQAPKWLCVNYLPEAQNLRDMQFDGRILVVGPLLPWEIAEAADLDLDVTIGNMPLLQGWLDSGKKPGVHIKVNTGMSRQGFDLQDLPSVIAQLSPHEQFVVGLSSHFANVEDVSNQSFAVSQLDALLQARDLFHKAGLEVMVHSASSASGLIMPKSHLDLGRIGISLYGLWPSSLTKLSYVSLGNSLASIKPVLSLKAPVAAVRLIGKGDFVGYGCAFQATAAMKIAVVSIGYAEGYLRGIGESSAARVLIRGQACSLVGRVCMNMIMVDVSHLAQVEQGDTATMIGFDGSCHLGAGLVASWANTISYELLAGLNPGIPRRVVNEPEVGESPSGHA